MNAEMDRIETNSQYAGICHRLLISVLPIDCPVCKALAISSRIFNFRASAPPSLAADNVLPRSWGGLLEHGLSILQRIYDFIMQILLAQAIKPVTLGSFKDNSLIQMPDLQASQSENGIEARKDQNMLLAAHQDPSAEEDCQPIADEKQAKESDDSARLLTDLGSSCSCPTPTLMQKARTPKKMVSINENIEIFPTSKNNRMMSKEWLSAAERSSEESKSLKSILKVGSKLTNVSTE